MICAAITALPPVKSRGISKTSRGGRKYYTLHTKLNDAFTLRVNDNTKTSIVGFRDWDDAVFVGKMLETYFIDQKEWPATYDIGALILPEAQYSDILGYLYIQAWDFEDLKVTCTKNFLDMISINNIIKKKTSGGCTFSGNAYSFEADLDFYRHRLAEINNLS